MKAVIMAGGHGTRLWPLSTKERPKQFQKILGEKTLLQAAYERLKFVKDEDIFVSTNQDFA
ncbi:mannose-1-phosphate guanylyltransferase, partial [Candidatus Peregrinibacteria bacterium CG_4_10_14_0_2_um_filter_41_8]